MKKEVSAIFSSPARRMATYLVVFAIGATLFEFFRTVVFHHYRSVIPGLSFVALFLLLGIFVINKRTLLSRISSTSVLLLLGTVAIAFDNSPIANSYLLLGIVAITYIGSQSFLHAKYSISRSLLIGASTATLAVLLIFFFLFFIRMRTFMGM